MILDWRAGHATIFLPCNNANATMKRAINVFGFQHCHIVATVVARCPALQTRHEHSSLQTLSALSSPCPGFKSRHPYLTCFKVFFYSPPGPRVFIMYVIKKLKKQVKYVYILVPYNRNSREHRLKIAKHSVSK